MQDTVANAKICQDLLAEANTWLAGHKAWLDDFEGCMDGQTNGCMDGRTDGWTDSRTKRRRDGWTNRQHLPILQDIIPY